MDDDGAPINKYRIIAYREIYVRRSYLCTYVRLRIRIFDCATLQIRVRWRFVSWCVCALYFVRRLVRNRHERFVLFTDAYNKTIQYTTAIIVYSCCSWKSPFAQSAHITPKNTRLTYLPRDFSALAPITRSSDLPCSRHARKQASKTNP